MRNPIILTICTIVLISCSSNELAIAPAEGILNKPAFGKEEQSVVYQLSSDETLSVHVQKIEESRCPSDVQCITAGYVKVVFQIDEVGEAALITPQFAGSNASEKFEFESRGRNYRLTLKDVTPHPTTKNYEDKKSVAFVLEQL